MGIMMNQSNRMARSWQRRAVLGWIIAAGVAFLANDHVPAARAQSAPASTHLQLFRIGTGGVQGTYFPIGNLIAASLSEGTTACEASTSCGIPGLLAVAQLSNGSVSNVEAISAGVLEAGLVQADVAHWAYSGTGVFSGKDRHANLRAVANLYQESVHIVVDRQSGISHIRDLKGRRVSLDEPGSGTLVDARIVLEAAGLSEKDLRPVYIKPQFAAEKLRGNGIDAFFIVAGYPTRSIAELAERGEARLVPVEQSMAKAIQKKYPLLTPSTIPANAYAGIAETETVSVSAQLLVNAALSDDLAYKITRALWSERTGNVLGKGHPKGREIRLESALDGIAVPLHPGAERFYRQGRLPASGG